MVTATAPVPTYKRSKLFFRMAQAFTQNSEQYLSHIDAEMERLQQLRNQVAEAIQGEKELSPSKGKDSSGRKGMSAEGRPCVAEAQKARWAKQKRAAKKQRKPLSPNLQRKS
ncbi:MAG: hypothetical protein ACRYGF_06010 [Janthinobacterium lividum]